jgi:hypothetical protein
MAKLFALTLWFLAFTVVLFELITDVWRGVIPPWQFVGVIALGVVGPLGMWAIARRSPKTGRFVWWLLLIIAWLVALAALCRLLIPPMP